MVLLIVTSVAFVSSVYLKRFFSAGRTQRSVLLRMLIVDSPDEAVTTTPPPPDILYLPSQVACLYLHAGFMDWSSSDRKTRMAGDAGLAFFRGTGDNFR
ncbi:hypothetical protein R3P38DRAFT_814106 [Favolaschia claudopus]|uniref:Secreted protein n=1 Tax=Favolaschia claudopus TaxID=2862362 RepID=A0AAW0BVB7_9AGAR